MAEFQHTFSPERKNSKQYSNNMNTEKRKPIPAILLIVAASAVSFLLFLIICTPQQYNLTVGSISSVTIKAPKDITDEVTTQERRNTAANAVEPTYHFDDTAKDTVMSALKKVFDQLRTIQQYGLTLNKDGKRSGISFTDKEIEYAQDLVKDLTLTRYQIITLLRTDTQMFDDMVSYVSTAVDNALSNTIREGQINQTIQTILQIVGFKLDLSLTQNIVPTILRTCLKPNMTIEQETTAVARQKAMDSVEPVVYLQGQNIIREGEAVRQNQLDMLKSLGLLTDNNKDYSVFTGSAILVALSFILLSIMIYILLPRYYSEIRKLLILLIAIILSVVFTVLFYKSFNVYFIPTVLGVILVTVLLGTKAGVCCLPTFTILNAAIALGGDASFLSDTILSAITTIVSGIVCLCFMKDHPQRIRVFICGFLSAITNALVCSSVHLITSFNFDHDFGFILWSAGGGFISAILAGALQPVFENVFRLATPSRLLELSNPNQPLLRRLMIEASGTYHHSIIVGNLAEAAASKIGANQLLARTGADYHDIGKLLRPLYFKENQIGDNPHDRTDPYVSATILISHTKDGLQLAQKARLPMEVQHIIAQHHGNTPVMYFYHKALQMSNGKPVDINLFRYQSRKPDTKESAIVMLADTIEAAVRSMHDPTPKTIQLFIERLVRGKLEDGQLSNAPLTLRDIDDICEAFYEVLKGVFHERIEYPQVSIPNAPADVQNHKTGMHKEINNSELKEKSESDSETANNASMSNQKIPLCEYTAEEDLTLDDNEQIENNSKTETDRANTAENVSADNKTDNSQTK